MKKALYRKQICAEKEKLTPEKVISYAAVS